MAFFLGIDLGASSLKATLIDEGASIIGQARVPLETLHTQSGYAEQDPALWYAALLTALADLRQNHKTAYDNIAALAMSGGAHIAVLCDDKDNPLRPAILWSDQRAHTQAQQLQDEGTAEKISGNRPSPTWTLPQLMWLREHEPESIAQCRRLYFAKDWLRMKLTGQWHSDSGEATGAMLADYKTGQWASTLLEKTGLTPDRVPPLVPITHTAPLMAEAIAATQLPAHAKVLHGTIDTTMEWLCCAPLTPHSASLKLASAGVIAISAADAKPLPPLSLYPHILPDTSYYAAGMNQCVPALHWVRQTLLRDMPQAEMEALAQTAPIGAGGVLFHPYLAGERAPLWRADATASLHGLHRGSTHSDIARAAYEGIGFALYDIWHDMAAHLPQMPETLTLLGGGAASDFWCQMLADILGLPLIRPPQTDASFAAALLSCYGTDAVHYAPSNSTIFTPDKVHHSRYYECYETYTLWRQK